MKFNDVNYRCRIVRHPLSGGRNSRPSKREKPVSYSVGYQIGADFKRQGVEINSAVLVKGIQDSISGKKPLMTAEEQHASLFNLQRKVNAQQKQDTNEKNKE